MSVDWSLAGPCRTSPPEKYFTDNPSILHAQQLCADCPIRVECGEYALTYDLYGVWGGLTRRHRRLIQQKRGIAPKSVVVDPDVVRRTQDAPRTVALWRASEDLRTAGLTLRDAAHHLGVSHAYLRLARGRARKHLAAAAS